MIRLDSGLRRNDANGHQIRIRGLKLLLWHLDFINQRLKYHNLVFQSDSLRSWLKPALGEY